MFCSVENQVQNPYKTIQLLIKTKLMSIILDMIKFMCFEIQEILLNVKPLFTIFYMMDNGWIEKPVNVHFEKALIIIYILTSTALILYYRCYISFTRKNQQFYDMR